MTEKFSDNHKQDEVKAPEGHENDHGKDMVTIYVNDVAVSIHRGSQKVAAIKGVGKVPSTDILYQMPNYEVALNDNDSVIIKGDERFKSSAPSGCSS